jgi:ribosomal RNA assembly protein
MEQIYIKSARKVLQNKQELEDCLNVEILVKGTNVSLKGEAENIYFAKRVLRALDFPFLVDDALLLKNEDFMFEVLKIKDFTHRKDLEVIKGRLIGTKGKTLRVLENLSECGIAVKGNEVAIIGPAEFFEQARQAIISLIQGSKQGNVYNTLERRRREKRVNG